MKRLRDDLSRLRVIAGALRRREHIKREQVDAVQNVLLQFFFPHEAYLRLAFEKITAYVPHATPHTGARSLRNVDPTARATSALP